MSTIPAILHSNYRELASAVVDDVIASFANRQQPTWKIGLAGGRTPVPIYELLATPSKSCQIDWEKSYIFLSDECMTDPHKLGANQLQIKKSLIDKLPETNYVVPDLEKYQRLIHSNGEKQRDEATRMIAQDYQNAIISSLHDDNPEIDLLILGVGEDAHTASIFPYSSEVKNPADQLIIPVNDASKPPPHRVSMSLKMINQAKKIIVIATGESKSRAVKQAFSYPPDPVKYPILQVRPISGKLVWHLDRQAASLL